MSAVRRWTCPILVPAAIGLSARAIGSTGCSLMVCGGWHAGAGRHMRAGRTVRVVDTSSNRLIVSTRTRTFLVLTAIGALAFATTAFAKSIVGSNAAERLTGTEAADVINGLGGRDQIR